MGSSPSLGTPPGAHLQGPGGHPVHDGGPLQAALLQLAQEDFIELLQVLGDGQVVVCWGRSGAQACPRTRRGSVGPAGWRRGPGPTVDDLPLALDDLLAEAAVLLQAAHGLAAVAERAVAEQRVRLHLGVLHLQLVHAAQQAEHLALLLGADAPRQRLLQAAAACAQLAAALLQRPLGGGAGSAPGSGQGAAQPVRAPPAPGL